MRERDRKEGMPAVAAVTSRKVVPAGGKERKPRSTVEPLRDATGHALEGGALGTEGEGTPLPRDHLLDVVPAYVTLLFSIYPYYFYYW